MERAVCDRCGQRQPPDWTSGDLCIACGGSVRAEVRCAWCAEWIPAVRFCRCCGCEVVGHEHYGAARMLKSAGVDRFSLVPRLRQLDPEQVANLTRIYNAQLAVVARRVEELRFCENHLLQNGFSKRLEEDLVPTLPLEKDQLAALAAGPQGSIGEERQALSEIAESSPIALTRALASIALLRLGYFKRTFAVASQALESDDRELALEAALAFAHWRVRVSPYELWWSAQAYEWGGASRGIDRGKLAMVAEGIQPGSPLRPWAAAAVALAWFGEYGVVPDPYTPVRLRPAGTPPDAAPPDWLRTELQAGLTGRDPDLRFACAMALGEDYLVIPLLESDDTQKRAVARKFLTARNSPSIARLLLESPEDIREEIVNDLQSPLPGPLLEPVLEAALRSQGSVREQCVRLLAASLNETMVERLVKLGTAEKDAGLFRILLGADSLPLAREVVRAILKAGLFVPLSNSLLDAARHVDFTDEELVRLVWKTDTAVIENLVYIAGKKIEAGTSEPGQLRDAGRFLARVAFSDLAGEVRERAYAKLEYGRVWDLFSPGGIRELFGGGKRFAAAILEGLEQQEPSGLRRTLLEKLSEQWAEVAEAFAEDSSELRRLVRVVAGLASGEESVCRSEATRLLVTVAVTSPAAALPAVITLLRERGSKWECREVPEWLLAGYGTLAPRLAHARPLAAELADVLAGMLPESSAKPALDLLVRLIRDQPALREPVKKKLGPLLDELDDIASALGYEGPCDADSRQQEEERFSAPDAHLDHVVVLPEAPLKSLAEYVAFLKAMGESGDPSSVMKAHGITQEDFVACVSAWGEALANDDKLALRYGQLVQ